MSKELTPIEALNDLIDYLELEHYTLSEDERVVERKQIIETALKDYEMEHTLRIRLENANYELVREKQENEKKLKALEIIKEKQVNVGDFIRCKSIEDYNDYCCYNEKEQLTQLEYDLLKKVLL